MQRLTMAVRLKNALARDDAPHLPPVRKVPADEITHTRMEKWSMEHGGASLEAPLRSGAVALIDAAFILGVSGIDPVYFLQEIKKQRAYIAGRNV